MKTNRFLLASIAAAAGLTMSSAVLAATTLSGGTFGAKITITANCLMSGSNVDLDFGSQSSNTASAANESTPAGFSVICTNGTAYQIGLQSTASGSTTGGVGTMKNGSNTIGYALFQDSGRTLAWGNSQVATVNTKTATGSGVAQPYLVYGKTTSTLNVPAGAYTDTVAVSVYY